MAGGNEDSYRYGIVNVALFVLMPLPMALGWIVRLITGSPASRKATNVLMGLLCIVAVAKGAGNSVYFLPATTLGILLKRQTVTQVANILLTEQGFKVVAQLVPLTYLLQELLLRLMNETPLPPQIEMNKKERRRLSCDHPQNVEKGVLIGVASDSKKLYITRDELNKHIALVGTTGSGKTTTLYNFVEYNALMGQACIIIDGKGDRDFLDVTEKICVQSGRQPVLFAIDGDYPGYNPFATGGPSEIADKIMSLMDYSEEHYEKNAQTFVQLLMRGLQGNQIPITFENIVRYFDKSKVQSLLSHDSTQTIIESDDLLTPVAVDPRGQDNNHYLTLLEQLDKRAIDGLIARLGTLASGNTWEALRKRPRGIISLSEALNKKDIVIFSLDSLKYPETARAFGRLVVGDIKAQISEHMTRRRGQRVGLLFDEFNVFASATVVDVVNKSRAAGFEALLAFQSLADIDVLDKGEEIRRQIIQNCNTLIVQRQNDPQDAEELSRVMGTKNSMLITQQISTDGSTGMGSARPERAFKVHPDWIKELKVGEAYVKRHTSTGLEIKKVWIRQPKSG
jgi:hypothetical protein